MKQSRTTSLKCFLLFAFVVSLFPIPLIKTKAKGGQPYPCQQNACGCSSAEQCWKSCCCYNDQQKLAWAKKHGVKPPEWFVAKAPPVEKASLGRAVRQKRKNSQTAVQNRRLLLLAKPVVVRPSPSLTPRQLFRNRHSQVDVGLCLRMQCDVKDSPFYSTRGFQSARPNA